jgi:hypothetical protein
MHHTPQVAHHHSDQRTHLAAEPAAARYTCRFRQATRRQPVASPACLNSRRGVAEIARRIPAACRQLASPAMSIACAGRGRPELAVLCRSLGMDSSSTEGAYSAFGVPSLRK